MSEARQDREEDLLRRFREGDEDAFRSLLGRYEGELVARIRRFLPHGIDRKVGASDVLQEASLVAFEHREDLTGDDARAFRNWLMGIARMKSMQAVRHHEGVRLRSRHREVTRAGRAETGAFPSRGPSPSEAAVGREAAELAARALELLPDDYREILRLAREERLGLKEAAGRMGRSHAAVRKLYGRAICRFREVFDRLRGGADGR